MTSSHHLLYRIAELMLQYEQHVLSVDLLFDDVQISDFVKSIQIDSPYQQMLIEGVLTETVRDEKLYVGFTVEGYFHYVLGEVIYDQIKQKGTKYVIDLIKNNKLIGILESIQQAIIKDIQENNLEKLIQLIDSGIDNLKFCSLPLSYAFIHNELTYFSKNSEEHKCLNVLTILLECPTKNDLQVLLDAIHYLENVLKIKLVKEIFNTIIDLIKPDSVDSLKLLCNCIQYIPVERRLNEIDKLIDNLKLFIQEPIYLDILVELGTQYYLLEQYESAIKCYTEASNSLSKDYKGNKEKLQKIYTNIGATYWRKNNLKLANEFFERTYKICLDLYGKHHIITSLANFNLGIIEASLENYSKALVTFKEVLNLELSVYGKNHITTARTYSNIGSVYLQLKEYEIAYNYFKQALDIDIQLLHIYHPSLGLDYDDIGDVYRGLNDFINAKHFYNKSLEIFTKNNGHDYTHTKLLVNKINALNDI